MRFKNLNFNEVGISEKTYDEGYSCYASYSKKESLKRGLVTSLQIFGITGFSYLAGALIRELYFSSMTSLTQKFEERSEKIDYPIRIPSYDEEGKEFYIEEFKSVEPKLVFYHEVFKERLRELPGLGFLADWIEKAENGIVEEKIKEYGPSMTLRIASEGANNAFQFLIANGVPREEAAKIATEYYKQLLSSPNVREYSEFLVREYIAKPIASYKMAETEANVLDALTGVGLFSTLTYKTFPNKVKALTKKAYSGPKAIYKKILTGGKEEIEEEEF